MLKNYDIYATMNIVPSIPCISNPTKLVITRGATASLMFSLTDKVYTFDSIDQLTYSLKQGSQLYWYKMFCYLVPSEDIEINPDKTYFTEVITLSPESLEVSGKLVTSPEGSPKANGYYEVVEGNHSWRDTNYIMDKHFYFSSGAGYSYVTLLLSSEETSLLKSQEIQSEVAIRLNTDIFENLKNTDSIIIEPQASISVVDSLYRQIGG